VFRCTWTVKLRANQQIVLANMCINCAMRRHLDATLWLENDKIVAFRHICNRRVGVRLYALVAVTAYAGQCHNFP